MRNFVVSHPDYKGDGVVTPSISDDLVQLCDDIGVGETSCPELLGGVFIRPLLRDDPYAGSEDTTTSAALCTDGAKLPASYKPQSYCSAGDWYSVLMGSGPDPDTYLDSSV
jgi:hypothetical protein